MSKVLPILLSGACFVFSSLSHSATTLISFDDVALNSAAFNGLPAGYNGLNWVNVAVMNPFAFQRGWQSSGAANGCQSASNTFHQSAPNCFYFNG